MSQTIWQTVADLTNKRYVFCSTTPTTIWMDLDHVDFAEGASARKLDLVGDTALTHGLTGGNVTHEFTACAPMQFLTLAR